MDNHDANLADLCHEVKSLSLKILEKTGFLLAVDNGSTHVIRSEVLSIIAMMNMVDAVYTEGSAIESPPFNVLSGQNDSLYECIERGRNYLRMASQSSVPDTKGSDLANILCQVPHLIPSAMLFKSVIKEIRLYRRAISEGLKEAITSGGGVSKDGMDKITRYGMSGKHVFLFL
jgi:hypothetical protein